MALPDRPQLEGCRGRLIIKTPWEKAELSSWECFPVVRLHMDQNRGKIGPFLETTFFGENDRHRYENLGPYAV